MVTTVAVIGTGSIGSRHLCLLEEMEGVTPIAVSVRNERRAELAEKGFVTAPSLQSCAESGTTKAIIATDTARHATDAIEAMRLGMDVLVEKPLAAEATEAERIRRVSIDTGRRCNVACVLRFSRPLERFQQLLPRVGTLHSVTIEARSYLPDWRPDRNYQESYSADASQGGVLRDLIHELDYACWIFGWPRRVCGKLENTGRLGIQAEEIAQMSWTLPSRLHVSIGLDYLTRPTRRTAAAYGELGIVALDLLHQTVCLTTCDGTTTTESFNQGVDDLYRKQLLAFLKKNGGLPSRLASVDDGVAAMSICDAVRQSSREGKTIHIPEHRQENNDE